VLGEVLFISSNSIELLRAAKILVNVLVNNKSLKDNPKGWSTSKWSGWYLIKGG
jgi:hypothetical protein